MILPESLYRPARTAENPAELLYRRVTTAAVPAGQVVQFARWPRDRMFIIQHLVLQVRLDATSGQSAALQMIALQTQNVSLWEVENVTNGVARAVRPDYAVTQAASDGVITSIGPGLARGSFDLSATLRGTWLPFGADLSVTGSVTGVGSTWQVRCDYSGWVVDRGTLIGGA